MAEVLSIIDVGHGNSGVAYGASGVVVIDAGSGPDVLEFLRKRGISSVDLVVLSHADQDHIGGLLLLLASEIQISKVILNCDSQKTTNAWKGLVHELGIRERSGAIETDIGIKRGSTLYEDSSIVVEAIAPTLEVAAHGVGSNIEGIGRITSNTISAVILIKYQGCNAAVFAADVDGVAITHIRQAMTDIVEVPILVFPHHGGLPGSEPVESFVQGVSEVFRPEYIVFSNGKQKFGNPRSDVIESISAFFQSPRLLCAQLSRGCHSGELARGPSISLDHANGKEKDACCYGSITLKREDGNFLLGGWEDNQAFIDTLDHPKCRRIVVQNIH